MRLKLVRTMWGVLDFTKPDPSSWRDLFVKLTSEGFQGIESPIGPLNPFSSNKTLFEQLREEFHFEWIAQIHTCNYPVCSRKVEDHLQSFRELVKEAKQWNPTFINSHSGSDCWSMEQNLAFFRECLKIEEEEGVKIVHETHRQRVLYNGWTTRDLLKLLPNLKVNADLSHFVCVAERVFDDDLDTDWAEILLLIAKNCHLIHARVGYAEGPQVPDPSAPEYSHELASHEKWWSIIWKEQASRGEEVTFVEPEFGPPPYLHTLPHTNVPVADLWKINTWVGQRQAERFASQFLQS